MQRGDVVYNQKILENKAGLLTRRLRSILFSGREERLLEGALAFLTLQAFYMHKNRYNTPRGREEMKKA